ncbi:hypothetical protein [Leptospira idonii]|uniref:Uncharacterized protein n=1 Tax=Leptospira idonii TaxID=1193500 RepID=A0A4R9M5A8_9LEPT|nr:hypothetical protein [Leptospira idonii]TGN20995.1 hypothetical protein EHS15_00290 [Leptospira idonii]
MRISTFVPVFVWILLILFGNYFLISSTFKNMDVYHKIPPFRTEDATRSGNLSYLLDQDTNTVWQKKNNSPLDWDFFVEMKLTHVWNGNVFSPRNFRSLDWKACPGQNLPSFEAKLLFRESINIDKDLRLPDDKLISVFRFNGENKKQTSFSLDGFFPLKEESKYPLGISIITVEVKTNTPNACFSEISLLED